MVTQTHWQDLYGGNWGTALNGAGVFKAGEGASFSDAHYQDWLKLAARDGHNAFGYYALHQGTKAAIVQQAKRAFSVIGKRPMMFDWEWWQAESGSPAGIATLAEGTEAIDTYRAAGGVTHVVYFPRSQWERIGAPNLAPLMERGMHLVNANYRPGSDRPGSAAWESYGGLPVFAVQYKPEHNVANMPWAQAKAIWQTGTLPGSTGPIVASTPYTVKAGDTLSSIAAAHKMTLATLERINPHAGHPAGNFDLILAGDHLTVTP